MHIFNIINQVTDKMKNINWKNHKEDLIKTLSGFEDRNFGENNRQMIHVITLIFNDEYDQINFTWFYLNIEPSNHKRRI